MRISSSASIWPVEIIPVEQKSQIEMHLTRRNNPCGTKEQDRDASDRGEIIPVEQKSKIEMHPAGQNNPCGTKESDRDASDRGEIIPVEQKSKIEMLISFKVAAEN